MKVGRLNFSTKKLEQIDTPLVLNTDEQLIVTVDQSSRGTGVTIGSSKTGPKEVLYFNRQSRETTGEYLKEMEKWLLVTMKSIRLLEFAPEMWFSSGYHESDKVMKQVFGVMENIYKTGDCLDNDGNPTKIKKQQPVFNPIPNKTWKHAIVPSEHFKFYPEDTDAYVAYATKIFPPLLTAGADCCASFLMYIFLIKTKYGNMKLKPSKTNIEPNHSLVLSAIPLEPINGTHPLKYALSKGTLNDPEIKTTDDLFSKYSEGYAKRFLSILKNFPYTDDYIGPVKETVDTTIGVYLQTLPKIKLQEKIEIYSSLSIDRNNLNLREIEMVDNMTLEKMFRSFTGRSKDIYFMVVEPSLHYNYLISQYRLQMYKHQKILVIGFRYQGGLT